MDRRQFIRSSAVLGGATLLAPLARATEPGVHPDKIVFGQSVGFESIWGDGYHNYTNGLLACFNHINAQGGVHGRRLELRHLEDNYIPEKTAANVNAFLHEDVFGLACLGGTGNTVAALPLIEQHRLPTVGTLTGAPAVRKASAPLFHTRATYSDEVFRMVQHATTIGLKRIAVVHLDNAFGAACAQSAQEAAQKFGAQIVSIIPHSVQGDDIDAVVQKINEARPHTTLLFTSPQSVANMLLRYHAKYGPLPLPQPWILSVTTAKIVFEKAGPLSHGVAITQVVPGPNERSVPLVREFREINDSYGVKTNQTYEAIEGFLTAKVIVEGLRACGANPTRESFINCLEAFGTRDFGGVRVHYDHANHGGLDYTAVAMIGVNGRIVS